jgi:hypothetical protein
VLRAVGKCGIEYSIEYQLLAFMQLFGPSEVRPTDEGQNPSDTDAASLPYRDHRKVSSGAAARKVDFQVAPG